jgi:hypothetical protein
MTYENKGYDKNVYPELDVEQTKNNGRSYPYLYLIRDLAQGASIEASMCAPIKEAF